LHLVALFSFKSVSDKAKVVQESNDEIPIRIKFSDEKKKMQIVDNTQQNKDKPIETKFLSKHNQNFLKQTSARNKGSYEEAKHGSIQNSKKQEEASGAQKLKKGKIKLSDLAFNNKPKK